MTLLVLSLPSIVHSTGLVITSLVILLRLCGVVVADDVVVGGYGTRCIGYVGYVGGLHVVV